MARWIVSFGMFWSVALSHASRRRGLADGSPPPRRAATVISRMRRVKILPRLASAAAFLCLMLAHLLWPAINLVLRVLPCCDYTGGTPVIRPRGRPAAAGIAGGPAGARARR